MPRSVIKVHLWIEHVLKKVVQAKDTSHEKSFRPGRGGRRLFPIWWASLSPCITARNSSPCSLPRIWSDTSLGEFSPTRTFHGHAGDRKAKKGRNNGMGVKLIRMLGYQRKRPDLWRTLSGECPSAKRLAHFGSPQRRLLD